MIPQIQLHDGTSIPQLGFGTFLIEPDNAEKVVSQALEAGYRHIDTAAFYGNEEGVGRAIRNSGIPREEIYLTTKLWNDRHDDADVALQESLDRLGLDYVDLYLLHWPAPMLGRYVNAWQELERQKAKGLTKSIGVCNFMAEHLEELEKHTDDLPVVNQIELHPFFQQVEDSAASRERNIHVEAWHPLAQFKRDFSEVPALTEPAAEYGKTLAQIILRWHIQTGNIVFPKTNSPERMKENLDIFDFELTEAQMDAIRALDQGEEGRIGFHPRTRGL